MPKTKSVGGTAGRRRLYYALQGMPGMPRAPKMGRSEFPSPHEQEQAQSAEVAQNDRYLTWANDHIGGGQYDFMVHDYLTYEKKLTEGTDFHWQTEIGGVAVDFYFPGRAHAWSLDSRDGFAPRPTLIPVQVTEQVAANTGVHHLSLFIEDLARNSKQALGDAWAGIQRS